MKLLISLILIPPLVLLGLYIWTSAEVLKIEDTYPPAGQYAPLSKGKFHYLDVGAGPQDSLPVLFVHGASGNLNDQRGAFERASKGKFRALFIDRPGIGYSERMGADDPAKQATVYKEFLDFLEIDKVVLVGHSLGSASVAAFAVLYPERVKGLVFLAPATHPWPGGVTWYYEISSIPLVGWLFTETVTTPVGQFSMEGGAKSVFDPQTPPVDYVDDAALPLILRPVNFRNNANDVAGLNAFVKDFSPRYKEIKVPTVVITGDKDDIVAPEIHSLGLERDIAGAELIILPGIGHKPDYEATDTAMDAIAKVMR